MKSVVSALAAGELNRQQTQAADARTRRMDVLAGVPLPYDLKRLPRFV